MLSPPDVQQVDTLVIGGGQAGLSAAWHLSRRSREFLVVDANPRVGDSWRARWDSLRLFTPARFNGLPGMRYPAPPHYFPTKDEMGDFLMEYARRFDLPVQSGVRVTRLSRAPAGDFTASADGKRIRANHVIVAMANYQRPWRPAFAAELDPSVRQLHSAEYRNPGSLQPGPVLLVGAGNSAAEIARELAPHHDVFLSGRDTGELPFRMEGLPARAGLAQLLLRGVFHRVLTIDTPVGRAARPKVTGRGGPLIRVKNRDLEGAGVKRVARMRGVREGVPELEDGRRIDVDNVIWCTGFRPGFESWIDMPVHGERDHEPLHRGGIVPDEPGLYFLGLHFLRAMSSAMVHGVGSDAEHIVRIIESRARPVH